MRTKMMVVAAVTLTLAASLTFLSAQPMRRAGWARPWIAPLERLAEFLNLTEEQKSKLEALRKSHQEEMKGLREKVQSLQKQLREARQDPKSDPKKLDSLVDEIFKVRAAQMKAQVRHQGEMENVLTKEQKEKLQQARQRIRPPAPRMMGLFCMGMLGRRFINPWGPGGRLMAHPRFLMRGRWLPRCWR
ncbi:MAG: Spy/CpxP family protein refolding chaperone [Candidatus Aminicenantales bacterium]